MDKVLCGCNKLSRPLTALICKESRGLSKIQTSFFSTSQRDDNKQKLVIVGGGCGGTAAAHIFTKKLGAGKVTVIEPSENHWYQPMWTLVGGGMKTFEQSQDKTANLLPKSCDWIQDRVVEFDPDKNTVKTSKGELIEYEYLLVAMGLQLNYDKVKGLVEALETDPQVCSNYWNKTVTKTYPAIENFKGGNAIFTFPNSPVKCAGAPQKIAYIAEECFRNMGKRDKAEVHYITSLGAVFGIKKYAEALMKVVKERNIQLTTRTHLIEVKPSSRECVFENLDTQETYTMPYELLHVSPPMSTPDPLRTSPLVDQTGFVTVNKETLQHTKYSNVFSIGDNGNTPNAKTAAAVASQTKALKQNLGAVMDGKPTGLKPYNGYTSCPLVTGKNKVILAEFDWNGEPMETFPFDQGKERFSMYRFKVDIFPQMYWHMLLKGTWPGPALVRKMMHLGFK